jgi:hypothetical protein
VLKILAICIAVVACEGSLACSFAPTFKSFVPDADFVEKYFEENDGPVPAVPRSSVSVIRVTRGTSAAGDSCQDAGTVTVRITWPRSSLYPLSDMGFYFRVVSGDDRDHIFPTEPVTPLRTSGTSAELLFPWLDGHPSQHRPLNLKVEVIPISKALHLGPSTFIEIK